MPDSPRPSPPSALAISSDRISSNSDTPNPAFRHASRSRVASAPESVICFGSGQKVQMVIMKLMMMMLWQLLLFLLLGRNAIEYPRFQACFLQLHSALAADSDEGCQTLRV